MPDHQTELLTNGVQIWRRPFVNNLLRTVRTEYELHGLTFLIYIVNHSLKLQQNRTEFTYIQYILHVTMP